MTNRMRQLGLAASAVLMALGLAAGVLTAAQNQNTNQTPPAFSGRMGPRPGGPLGLPFGPMGLIGPIANRLGLSDAQKDQLKGIMDAHHDEFTSLADRAAAAHKALEQVIMTDPVNDAAVQQASEGVAAVQSEMAVASAHVRAEIFQILTEEQKGTLKQLIANRDQRPRHGRGR